jgi:uncharacterized protein (DUF488 family)
METPEFEAGLARLRARAAGSRSALMCAEALPWKCHRSLIADLLVVRGGEVIDLLSPTEARSHALPPFARREGERVVYDG